MGEGSAYVQADLSLSSLFIHKDIFPCIANPIPFMASLKC